MSLIMPNLYRNSCEILPACGSNFNTIQPIQSPTADVPPGQETSCRKYITSNYYTCMCLFISTSSHSSCPSSFVITADKYCSTTVMTSCSGSNDNKSPKNVHSHLIMRDTLMKCCVSLLQLCVSLVECMTITVYA